MSAFTEKCDVVVLMTCCLIACYLAWMFELLCTHSDGWFDTRTLSCRIILYVCRTLKNWLFSSWCMSLLSIKRYRSVFLAKLCKHGKVK